jgi:secreted Zn-dependent insulinase-like peptidase
MSLETTTLTILTEQLIASPFFNALRNEQQLGYLVGTGYVPYNQIPGIALYVQSPKASVQELIIAMHVFLEKMVENIEKHSKFWNSIKKGLIKQVSEKDTSLSMRSQRLWLAIGNKDHNFSHAEKMINIIHSISIIDIKTFIVDLLNQQNSGEIILYSGKFDNLNTLKNTQHIDNPRHFKQNTRYI